MPVGSSLPLPISSTFRGAASSSIGYLAVVCSLGLKCRLDLTSLRQQCEVEQERMRAVVTAPQCQSRCSWISPLLHWVGRGRSGRPGRAGNRVSVADRPRKPVHHARAHPRSPPSLSSLPHTLSLTHSSSLPLHTRTHTHTHTHTHSLHSLTRSLTHSLLGSAPPPSLTHSLTHMHSQ